MTAIAVSRGSSRVCEVERPGEGASYKTVGELPTTCLRNGGKIIPMTFGWSVFLLVIVLALIGALAVAWFAPRRRRVRRDKELKTSLDPVSDPPTVTHYGHA